MAGSSTSLAEARALLLSPLGPVAVNTGAPDEGNMFLLGRIGTPEDVAEAVAYFANEATSFVTGTVMDVNGGHYMG